LSFVCSRQARIWATPAKFAFRTSYMLRIRRAQRDARHEGYPLYKCAGEFAGLCVKRIAVCCARREERAMRQARTQCSFYGARRKGARYARRRHDRGRRGGRGIQSAFFAPAADTATLIKMISRVETFQRRYDLMLLLSAAIVTIAADFAAQRWLCWRHERARSYSEICSEIADTSADRGGRRCPSTHQRARFCGREPLAPEVKICHARYDNDEAGGATRSSMAMPTPRHLPRLYAARATPCRRGAAAALRW